MLVIKCRPQRKPFVEEKKPPSSDKFPVLVVLNPNAGRKDARKQYDDVVKRFLDMFDMPDRLIETLSPGFAQSFFRDNIQQILIDLSQSLAAASISNQTDNNTAIASQPISPPTDSTDEVENTVAATSSTVLTTTETESEEPIAVAATSSTPTTATESGDSSKAATASQNTAAPNPFTLRIVIMGGDGTVHEVVNGILQGIPSGFLSGASAPKIEFNIVPVGTGNAIATSLGIADVGVAIHKLVHGTVVPMRLIKVSRRSKELSDSLPESAQPGGHNWKDVVYTVVVNSFGLHCATVSDSDEYRSLGNSRFKVAALKNIVFLNQYKARVDFFGPVQKYDRTLKELVPVDTGSDEDLDSTSQPSLTLSGPFTYLMFSKQAFLEPGFQPTPLAKTSDDWLDVLAVQNVGRIQIMQILQGATKDGQHMDHENVEYFKAKVVELEAKRKGRLCIDGEFLDIEAGSQGRVRFEVVQDLSLQVFSTVAPSVEGAKP
ncbi:MAG: ATP-NAD kinase-like domain-containing protein [Benniella sp.]|nr:MAG: ATP-NAD kinase-like domain-containing protein [Benniella sp.]